MIATNAMNVVLLVIDSLRSDALISAAAGGSTSFASRLKRESVCFQRAYATECWTLPAHLSMFTGLLPSQHGAHFQSMAYTRSAPTIAEILTGAGFYTEIVTRNSIFDGSLPGVTRGFQKNTRVFSARSSGLNLLSFTLALSKPRFRRQIMTSGFFHPLQQENLSFLTNFARATVPADREALAYVQARMETCRRLRKPYFLFCNLYDVHAPYPPSPHSIFRSPWSLSGLEDTLRMPFVMPKLGGHQYLRAGFRMSARSQAMLRGRYRDAVALMEAKLASFLADAEAAGLLDDTLLIVTSDHGEGFGEHGLYLHDASVYQTHLHVPLFVRHPELAPVDVQDVVSTRDLFGLIRAMALGEGTQATILNATYRAEHAIALAEHFHYEHLNDALPQHRENLVAAIAGENKIIVRPGGTAMFRLTRDPDELRPEAETLESFARRCRHEGVGAVTIESALHHVRGWRLRQAGAPASYEGAVSD